MAGSKNSSPSEGSKSKTTTTTNNKKSAGRAFDITPYVLGFAALLLAALFTMESAGFLGDFLTPVFKGLFGFGVFAIPFYLIILALFWKSDKKNGTASRIFLCIANFVFLLLLFQLHTASPEERQFSGQGISFLKVFYQNGVKGIGAGALGGSVGSGIEFLVGTALSYAVGYLITAATFVFIVGLTPGKIFACAASAVKNTLAARQNRKVKKVKTKTPVKEKPESPVQDPYTGFYNEKTAADEVQAPPYSSIFDEEPEDSFLEETSGTPASLPPVITETSVANADTKETAAGVATLIDEEKEDESVYETSEIEAETSSPVYVFPPISLLSEGTSDFLRNSSQNIALTGQRLISVLKTYGVKASMVSTSRGPAVTRYEVLPDEGIRVSRIEGLADDIRMRLAASSVRIESNIPGKAAIGIEIPNETASIVKLRDLIDNDLFRNNPSKLFVCLGVDVGGNPIYFDIPDMPHLLIAGATGMGKSVCLNSIIVSLLYRATPDEVKFILIDPKKIELSSFNGIPHLLVPVVNEPRTAAGSLNWAVNEMERRYTLLEQLGNARNLEEYNEMVEGDPERERLPYIVIIIDELADLIMSAKDAVENSICRLAQKARAAGIHLVVGTQRPSTDVITGLIKANIPSRIAFTVSQSVDSRIILDENGAEALLGKGDMIYAPVKMMKKLRVQGAYVDGKTEVTAVCQFIKNAAKAEYNKDVMKMIEDEAKLCGEKPGRRRFDDGSGEEDKEDVLFYDAIGVGFEFETMSTSLLQRKLSIGYARAQKIIDMLEERAYVGKFDPATKKRKILISREEYDELRLNRESKNGD